MISFWKFKEYWNWKSRRKFKKIQLRFFPNIKTKLNWNLNLFFRDERYSIFLSKDNYDNSKIHNSPIKIEIHEIFRYRHFDQSRLSQIIPKYLQVDKLLNIFSYRPTSQQSRTHTYIYIYICQSIQFHSFTLRFHNTPLLPNLTCRWIIVTNPSKPSDPTIASLWKERNSIKIPVFHPCSISFPDPLSLLPPFFFFKRRRKRNSSRENGIRRDAYVRARRMQRLTREGVAQAENGAIT